MTVDIVKPTNHWRIIYSEKRGVDSKEFTVLGFLGELLTDLEHELGGLIVPLLVQLFDTEGKGGQTVADEFRDGGVVHGSFPFGTLIV